LCTLGAFAQERSYEDLKKVALNFSKTQSKIKHKIKITQIKSRTTAIDKNKEYRIINLDPQGWVIVSKDDIATPILAYSLTGSIGNERSLAPAFKSWMKGINAEIVKAKEAHIDNDTYIDKWDNLTAEAEVFDANQVARGKSSRAKREKGPLLEKRNINWGQDYPYNAMTPKVSNAMYGYNGRAPVGCAATAIAQIMAYHKWPNQGQGSHTDKNHYYGTLKANFNTHYNWNNMSNYDYAKISYHVGISIDMTYGPFGSDAWGFAPIHSLKTYFKYNVGSYLHKNYTLNWDKKIKQNIDSNLPIYYEGGDNDDPKKATFHTFVLDGYSYNNSLKFYHFNLGWGGDETAWYALNAISPHNFNYMQSAIFDISPDKETVAKNPTNVTFTNLTSTTVTIKWKDKSDNERGFKIYNGTKVVATVGKNITSYKIVNLNPNTTYRYTIRPYNDKGTSSGISIRFKTKNIAWLIPAVYYPCLF